MEARPIESPTDRPTPGNTEYAYNRLAGYGFARRYVEGKSVADLDPEGTGAHILAATAESVTCIFSSPEALERAREADPAPNLTLAAADLPELSFPDASLDVVVVLEIVEDLQDPEALVAEARRALKDDGTLIVAAPDRQAFSNQRARGLYAAEFRELLGRHFEHVEIYRLGAVSGAVVFEDSGGLSGLSVESVPFVVGEMDLGDGTPDTDLILAVCGGTELPVNERPYLILDRDRRLLDEREDALEDVELLKAEIQQMQQTEVKTFHETIAAHEAENARLRRRLDDIERSRVYRLLSIYRRLRAGLDHLAGRIRGR